MVFPQLRVDEMESLIPLVEAVFDERARHPVLLVDAVEESADVAVWAEHASGKPHGAVSGYHVSPPDRRVEGRTRSANKRRLRIAAAQNQARDIGDGACHCSMAC